MARVSVQLIDVRAFDNLAGVHNLHPVCHTCYHTEVVSDKQDSHVTSLMEIMKERKNLRLNGNIQGGRWLVGNEQLGFRHEGDSDHYALPHTA
jgi:hypothetical protein